MRGHHARRGVWVAVVGTAVVALGAGSAVFAADSGDREAQDAALDAALRVDGTVQAASGDAALDEEADLTAATVALAANRARTAAQARSVVDQANAVLAATPNAGDGPRGALGAASSTLATSIAAPATSPATWRRLVAGVAAPQRAATDGQNAWQTAENVRVAAEQAAAAAVAHDRAPVSKSASRSAVPRPRSGSAAAPAPAPAAASSGVPAGGRVCTSAGSGAGESSVAAIGAAINAYRAGLGLPRLSVSRSGALVGHAVDMANAGGIWHAGDNIVACVPGSASAMVSAWSRSPGHDAQMRRTDVSSMAVGGASRSGWLYGSVRFG
ncbi:hypothetical protein [Cellulomonas sp. URHD0024]|uniref:hypothetical protein n=1 Tax=Cellulomonas sp. URHD0024 TaxID=1302620 RepID=UPI0012DD52E3|nr:hypothetical protein [Cellulomonas sp. URHD0024]